MLLYFDLTMPSYAYSYLSSLLSSSPYKPLPKKLLPTHTPLTYSLLTWAYQTLTLVLPPPPPPTFCNGLWSCYSSIIYYCHVYIYSGRNEISARNGISALTFKYKYGDVLQTFQTWNFDWLKFCLYTTDF
jgi:hypothetical protein